MKVILYEIIIYYLLCAQSAGIGASKILLVGWNWAVDKTINVPNRITNRIIFPARIKI